jgi:hypothetical protein
VGGFDLIGLLPLLLIVAAVVGPMLFGRYPAPPDPRDPRDPRDDDSGDGGGGSGPPPIGPRGRPGGGIPLPDAVQARVRLRSGHERLADLVRRRDRRPAREPVRAPLTTPRLP